jgi:hypothetical protein
LSDWHGNMMNRSTTHSVQPHLVNIASVLIFRQLDAPFPTVLIRSVFPRRDDALLEEIIIGLLRQLGWLDDIVVQSDMRFIVSFPVHHAVETR